MRSPLLVDLFNNCFATQGVRDTYTQGPDIRRSYYALFFWQKLRKRCWKKRKKKLTHTYSWPGVQMKWINNTGHYIVSVVYVFEPLKLATLLLLFVVFNPVNNNIVYMSFSAFALDARSVSVPFSRHYPYLLQRSLLFFFLFLSSLYAYTRSSPTKNRPTSSDKCCFSTRLGRAVYWTSVVSLGGKNNNYIYIFSLQ